MPEENGVDTDVPAVQCCRQSDAGHPVPPFKAMRGKERKRGSRLLHFVWTTSLPSIRISDPHLLHLCLLSPRCLQSAPQAHSCLLALMLRARIACVLYRRVSVVAAAAAAASCTPSATLRLHRVGASMYTLRTLHLLSLLSSGARGCKLMTCSGRRRRRPRGPTA